MSLYPNVSKRKNGYSNNISLTPYCANLNKKTLTIGTYAERNCDTGFASLCELEYWGSISSVISAGVYLDSEHIPDSFQFVITYCTSRTKAAGGLGCDRPDTTVQSGATGGACDRPVGKAARGPAGPPKTPFWSVTGVGSPPLKRRGRL